MLIGVLNMKIKTLEDLVLEYSHDVEVQKHFIEGFKSGAHFSRELYIHKSNEITREINRTTDIYEQDNYWDLEIKRLKEIIKKLEYNREED